VFVSGVFFSNTQLILIVKISELEKKNQQLLDEVQRLKEELKMAKTSSLSTVK
jgi:hypothetical protein